MQANASMAPPTIFPGGTMPYNNFNYPGAVNNGVHVESSSADPHSLKSAPPQAVNNSWEQRDTAQGNNSSLGPAQPQYNSGRPSLPPPMCGPPGINSFASMPPTSMGNMPYGAAINGRPTDALNPGDAASEMLTNSVTPLRQNNVAPPGIISGPPHLSSPPPNAASFPAPAPPMAAVHGRPQQPGLPPYHQLPTLPPQSTANSAPMFPGPPRFGAPSGPLSGGMQAMGPPMPRPGFPPQGYPSNVAPSPGMAPPHGMQAPPHFSGSPGGVMPPVSGMKPPGMAPAPQPGQFPAQRINPDHLPSAVQVQEDDRAHRSGYFDPNERGKVPPLVTTDFHSYEVGESCSPNFMRSSLYQVPLSNDGLKQLHLQFSVVCTPFAPRHCREQPIPCSDMGTKGPLRCIRCKAYMSPSMLFKDGGRRFQCVLCGASTDVEEEYFVHLDHNGRRVDSFQRPELCLSSYELIATAEYCRNDTLPNAPAFLFALDVSAASVKSGLLSLFCSKIRAEILPFLPREENDLNCGNSPIRIGFMTYDRVVQFYNLKPCLTQPQVLVVSDVNDVFVPLVDGFFVKAEEADQLLESLMDMIERTYTNTASQHQLTNETILGPVLQASMEAFKAANCSGKVFLLHCELPTCEAPGQLKLPDGKSSASADKSKVSTYYTELGRSCAKAGISVDVFLCPHSYVDAGSICEVAKFTGGSVFKYNDFNANIHGEQFLGDLRRAVSSPCGFDSVIRLRTSTGTRPIGFYGNFHMENTTDVDVACLQRDSTLVFDIKYDDKLAEGENVFLQLACLYTSVSGKRRIRIHNLRLQATSNQGEIFRTSDLDAFMNVLMKEALHEMEPQQTGGGGKAIRDLRDKIAFRCIRILAAYRSHCASQNNPSELVLPEQMKLLPVYCNSLANGDIFNPNLDLSSDDRAVIKHYVNSMTVAQSNISLYPRLLPLHNVDIEGTTLPVPLRCSAERLEPTGVYLLENGITLFLWFGQQVSSDWLASVFGVNSSAQLTQEHPLIMQDNPHSKRIFSILDTVKSQRTRSLQMIIVRQNERQEMLFKRLLVEDRGEISCLSYADYLCNVHKEVKNILNG